RGLGGSERLPAACRERVAGSPELRGCLASLRLPRPAASRGPADPASPDRRATPAGEIPRSGRFVRALGFRDGLLLALLGRLEGVVCPQRQPPGSDGEHTRDESGGEEAEAELFLTLGRHLGGFCSLPLRRLRGLGGFTQAMLVLQFILL